MNRAEIVLNAISPSRHILEPPYEKYSIKAYGSIRYFYIRLSSGCYGFVRAVQPHNGRTYVTYVRMPRKFEALLRLALYPHIEED